MSGAHIVVSEAADGQRVDHFVCQHAAGLGRAAARRFIDQGLVRVNGRVARAGQRVRGGDRVELPELPASSAALADPELALCVLHEDAELVVVDKPAGIASHPLRPGERGTLASALLARYPEMAGVGYSPREPGLVHRLDTDTSGVVLAARDAATFDALRAQLERGALDKRYLALCAGAVAAPRVHEAWLSARGRRVTLRAQPFAAAERVETELTSSLAYGAWSLVGVRVHRARRHQIRAHLAALGHAIAGDATYGGAPLPELTRHFLHASELRFAHPRTGEALAIAAALPPELRAALARAGA
jgi:23S rRNA pseudouridine1911/1915/1917 synthase